MKKSYYYLLLLVALLPAFRNRGYEVRGIAPDSTYEGRMAYLYDYHTESRVDSAVVEQGRFLFKGRMKGDSVRRIDLGRSYANLILERGKIEVSMSEHNASGSEGNDRLRAFMGERNRLLELWEERYQAIRAEAAADTSLDATERRDTILARSERLAAEMNGRADSLFASQLKGRDDAFEAFVIWEWLGRTTTPAAFDAIYARAGSYARDFGPVQRNAARFEALRGTQEGMPFRDFTGKTADAQAATVSLSDHVGRGKWVLVDFWASWCGPCRNEMPVIRSAWERHAGERFEVVGVAVWDRRDATLAALQELGIPWPQIVDTGTKPVELYGIGGIPHLILFAPDGTIAARDLRGDALLAKLDELL